MHRADYCALVPVTLEEITEDNAQVVLALRCTPDQERFVSSVAYSLTEAAENPQGNPWFRAVYADNSPVGFVMLSWDVEPQPPRSMVHGFCGSCSSTAGTKARATAERSWDRSLS